MRYEQAQATYRAMLDANSHIRRVMGDSLRLHYFSGFVYHPSEQGTSSHGYTLDYTINSDTSRARHRLTRPHNSAYFVAIWQRREAAEIDKRKLTVWQRNSGAHLIVGEISDDSGATWRPMTAQERETAERETAEREYNATERAGISHATDSVPEA